jgi:prepilin-type N-terminal cleavage/methylation domain-containing protein
VNKNLLLKLPLCNKGLTLVEIMIAVAVISVGILGAIGAFNGISKSLQYSKARTLAANLAQEKMQIVMQKSYYDILVTTAAALDTDFTPNIPYDQSRFPPEQLLEGSISFTRLTYVQVVQENAGNIQVLSPTTPDTGMRQITVTVVWQQGSDKKFHSLRNVINNPNTVMASSIIAGKVKDSVTTIGIPGALVNAAENVGWRNNADASGNYSINLSPGNFTLIASAQGYFSRRVAVTAAPNSTASQDFSLTRVSTGTIQGNAWMNNHLVISQIVASTGTTNDIEYVELYNPTTSFIYIGNNANNGDGGNPLPAYVPILWGNNNGQYQARHLYYVNFNAPSKGFYLISNTGNADPATACANFTASGIVITPDACWRHVPYNAAGGDHAIECGGSCPNTVLDSGGLTIVQAAGVDSSYNLTASWASYIVDSIGWNQKSAGGNAAPSNAVRGTALTPASNNGLQPGEQFVRTSQPGSLSAGVGRAYNSNNNANDFSDFTSFTYRPYTTANIYGPLAGTPAAGALVFVNDGLSSASTATFTGSPPTAQFTVPGVATGTWNVFITSGAFSTEIDTVTVTSLTTTSIPNAATSPPWPANGAYSSFLSSNTLVGMISGHVTDVNGSVISPSIVVGVGGNNATVDPAGNYSIRLSTGTYNVVANPGNANANFGTQTQPNITINRGAVTANVNFTLAQGGKVSGWVTRDGTNPLPGVSVVAQDANGTTWDTEVSGANGTFTLINLTTGTYTVKPILDTKEQSAPPSTSALVTMGTTVSAGTFTVAGAMGTVTGNMTTSGQPINTGVLIIISTTTLLGPTPPALNAGGLTGSAYYVDSSKEDGSYSIDVRGSTTTTYNINAFYMTLNNQTPVISSQTITNVSVTAGQTTSGENFSW